MTNDVQANGTTKAPPKILPFEVHDGFDISTTAPAQIPSLVEGLLLQVGTSMVSAKPKSGKSSLLRTLAVSIAEGRRFFGLPTIQGDVLYLNLEGPRGVVASHLKQLGLSGRNGRLRLVDERMPLKGELGLERLKLTIEKFMPLSLVILDPAAKILRLMDSYDPNAVGLAIEELETIAKKYKLHLMFSSHSKKKLTDDVGDGPIGSTSFRGGTDTNIFIVREGKNRIISTEQRWGIEMEPRLLLKDEYGKSVLGDTLESVKEAHSERRGEMTRQRVRKDILAFLCGVEANNPTKAELLEAVSGNDSLKMQIVSEMVEAGDITEDKDGRALRYSFARIPVEHVVEDQAGGMTI